MDFTREPIIQSVITPKDGCKLVVRSSKASSQEEFFVDAVEMVSFGETFFFRSLERPKAFLVPCNDYEVLEVREARLVLKNAGLERSIKIGGGKKEEPLPVPTTDEEGPKTEKKKNDRKKLRRSKRSKDDIEEGQEPLEAPAPVEPKAEKAAPPKRSSGGMSALLPPPNTLISETIARYKDDALFKDAFFSKEEKVDAPDEEFPTFEEEAEFGVFDLTTEEEEEIRLQRERREPVEDFINSTHDSVE